MEGGVEMYEDRTKGVNRRVYIEVRLVKSCDLGTESSARPLYAFHLVVNLLPCFSGA